MLTCYFETSAINALARGRNARDAVATRAFQSVRGRRWVISPVCLWEIMATPEAARREWLIHFSQNLFDRELLPSPEELIVDYIRRGFPLLERQRELISKAAIADTWRDIVDTPSKTLIYDHAEFASRLKYVAKLNRLIHRVIRDENIPLFGTNLESGTLATLESLLSRKSFYRAVRNDPARRKIFRIAAFYLMLILCAEAGFETHFIKRLWRKVGIDRTIERIRYAFAEFEPLLYRGPLALLATMTYLQTGSAFSRGIFFDSLHAFYTPYIDLFFTNDRHFVELREKLKPHPNAFKIFHMNELQITTHERSISTVKGIIAT